MKLTDIAIKRPVFAWMMMAATVVFGAVGLYRMGVSQYPDVDYPTVSVSITYEGAAPDVVENDVIEFVEEAVAQVEGVKSITSTARQGEANVTVEFDISRDIDQAVQDVQNRIGQIRQLPENIDPPIVSKSNPEDQPIMWVGLSGPYPQALLSDTARYRVKDRLQAVTGVGEIQLGGYLERNVRVWIDADKLAAYQLTVSDVTKALQREHIELPAGRLESGSREVGVRVLGEALDLATLQTIIVKEVAGAPVRLSDVSLVEDGFEDVRRRSRVNGAPVQGMGIRKQRGANAVQVAADVNQVIDDVRKTLPEGMELSIIFDSTEYIKDSVHEVQFELILAVILTSFVCWLLLGSISSTLNVVLAIPMSLLGTIAVIYFLGWTLNMFTLLALSLAVGIVVDDAIMVMENIFRHGEAGKDRITAAREGTQEIAFAALAATIAVIAIFIPVVFMEGIVGKYFLQFGVTLSVAVALSYLEAVTLAPSRCAQLLKTSREGRSWIGRVVDRGFEKLSTGYAWLLTRNLRWPLVALGAAALLLYVSFRTLGSLPAEMVPSQDISRVLLRLQTAPGSSLEQTEAVTRRAEEFINGRPEVTRAMFAVGGMGGAVDTVTSFVSLKPADERDISQQEFQNILRKELNSYPGIRAVVQDLSQQGFSARRGFPIEFSVRGADWDKLVATSKDVIEKLSASSVVVDVDSDYKLGTPELQIAPDRDLASYMQVPVEEIATSLNALLGGLRIGKYTSNGRRVDVRVRLLASQRKSPEDVARLQVRSATGALLPLSALVHQEEKPSLQAITRRDRDRAITIFANVAPGHSQEEAIRVVEQLGKQLPPEVFIKLGGQSVAFQESFSSLGFALMLGICIAYMVLASQFNSFLHPITVLTILPLSVAGAIFAIKFGGKTLNIFSAIGLLLLMGIVKKNSIILVDYANQLRQQGLGARDAMRRAGPVRLRPILMTSIATGMAALPAALALGPGGEVRAPMAIAVIGGLVVSTAMSLFVVPSFYVCADWLLVHGRSALRRRGKRPGDRSSAPPPPPSAPPPVG
ncbi:MAG TPA: efflux RND transporter permease subunit [Kofleriaceae bacterium]|nr:efflux RND transporter permease subunit [Kofleriaceae bacterium]